MIIFNTIDRIRSMIGGLIALMGLFFFIPSLILLILSGTIYGSPMMGFPIVKTIPLDGSTINVELQMPKNNNYDLKYQLHSIAESSKPNGGEISVLVNTTSINSQITNFPKGILSEKWFNESTLYGQNAYPANIKEDENLVMTFQVASSKNIVKSEITINLYQNPNRELSSIFSTIGILLMIPAIVLVIVGGVIAGKNKRHRIGKLGKGELYFEL